MRLALALGLNECTTYIYALSACALDEWSPTACCNQCCVCLPWVGTKGESCTNVASAANMGTARMQQLLGQARFAEQLDCGAVIAAVAPALRDRRLDNDRDVYRSCLSIVRRVAAIAPTVLPRYLDAAADTSLVPGLTRLLALRPKEDAIPQEVRCCSTTLLLPQLVRCVHHINTYADLQAMLLLGAQRSCCSRQQCSSFRTLFAHIPASCSRPSCLPTLVARYVAIAQPQL